MRKKNWIILFIVVFMVVICDQITKQAIYNSFVPGEQISIIPNYFSFTLVFNKGVAFGLLANLSDFIRTICLVITHLLALAFVLFLLVREFKHDSVGQIALGLILGGAIGNLVDRINLGMVIDFIDVYYKNYHWPAFNIADSMIFIGVAYLIFHKPKEKQKEQKAE